MAYLQANSPPAEKLGRHSTKRAPLGACQSRPHTQCSGDTQTQRTWSCCQRAASRVTRQTFVKQQKNCSNNAERAGVFLRVRDGSKPFWLMGPGQGLWRGRQWTAVLWMARTWRLNLRPHHARKLWRPQQESAWGRSSWSPSSRGFSLKTQPSRSYV